MTAAIGGPTPRRRQAGIALVLVLWVLALLTVMALGLTMAQRTESALTRNQIDGARFRALADAAINLVALDLLTTPVDSLDPEAPEVWRPDGQPREVLFDGSRMTVRLYNESSRLDLNRATREQLAALIEVAQGEEGFDAEQRDRLADAIVDWRDQDDMVSLNGAEDGDYEDAGLAYGARDGDFRSVEELRGVLGMTPALYRQLAPDLTVDNPSGRVEQQFASAALIAAIQGIALDDAQAQVDQRLQPLLPDGRQAVGLNRGGPLYRVRVTLEEGAARRAMEALVLVRGGGDPPVQFNWRRYGLVDAPSLPSSADEPPDGAR